MRRILTVLTLLAAIVLAWLWTSGGIDQIAAWAKSEQREFQNGIARTLRALRSGQSNAIWALIAGCFAYGFVHAIGPGHGKILMSGYGFGRKVPWLRMVSLTLLSSLGQVASAIILTSAGMFLLNMGRESLVGTAERVMAPASYAAFALIGLWLLWRGIRKIRAINPTAAADHHDHHHDHSHDHHTHDHSEICPSCGHAHGPTLEQVENSASLREMLTLIGSIAIRPCTGALFVLIITFQMGIPTAGILGVIAMALGTASVVLVFGLGASLLRSEISTAFSESVVFRWLIPVLEVSAGLVVCLISSSLLLRSIL